MVGSGDLFPHGAVRSGAFTTTGTDSAVIKATFGESYHGYGTVAVWGTWNGHTVKIRAQMATGGDTQLVPPNPATGNWVDIEGMSLTADGFLQPQIRATWFQIQKTAATGTPNLKWAMR